MVRKALRACFSSKQLGYEDFLSDLVGNACSKLENKTHKILIFLIKLLIYLSASIKRKSNI